jgi:hypothetical protein
MLGARSRIAGRICSTRRVRPRSVVHRRGVMRGSARCAVYAAGDRGAGVVPQIEANDAGRKSNARRRRSLVARGGGCGPRRPRSSVRMQYNSQCATRRRCPRCMQPALLRACTSSFCHRAASRLRRRRRAPAFGDPQVDTGAADTATSSKAGAPPAALSAGLVQQVDPDARRCKVSHPVAMTLAGTAGTRVGATRHASGSSSQHKDGL